MGEPANPARQVVEDPALASAPSPARDSAPNPGEPRRVTPMPAPEILPGRASPSASSAFPSAGQQHQPHPRLTGAQRAMRGLRAALPLVQKVLPLLEGQVFTTVSNLLAPHTTAPPADLSPLENSLADLRTRHAELSGRLAEQSAALKRMADRLEDSLGQVQAAADRNALEQKELREGLQSAGRKANRVAILALCLLALSVAVNLFLFLHFQRLLR